MKDSASRAKSSRSSSSSSSSVVGNVKCKLEPDGELIKQKELDILKQFDLDYKFGPCYGI